jgi:DNA mismatch repair protein MutL
MGQIKVLSDDLINKIAAGEVIERPHSVVKELVENAIDAGAKRILVSAVDGGTKSIKVADDGCGMVPEDARLCIARHATSKISVMDDLADIKTLGFRGEALSSIASVSRLRLRTSTGGEGIEISAGEEKPYVMPRGTTVIVQDIFHNVPARRKQLKIAGSEYSKIVELMTRFALAYPNVFFELEHDGKSTLSCPPADLLPRICSLYGAGMAEKLAFVESSIDGISVRGYVSRPGFQRPDKSQQMLFVNGRIVRNKLITDAVYAGYKTFLNVGKHPAFFLHVSLDPTLLDVNVHPQKATVRLHDEDRIFMAVSLAVRDVLPGFESPEPTVSKVVQPTLEKYEFSGSKQRPLVETKHEEKQQFRILGQVLRTYAIVAMDDGLVIVDQHAAAERVAYEKYLEQFRHYDVQRQELLGSLTIELSPSESVIIGHQKELIERLGFSVEEFGRHVYRLSTIPAIFNRLQGRDVFLTIVDELKSSRPTKLDSVAEELIIRKACKGSIKGNEHLEHNELVTLLTDLFKAKQPYTCPHGRPTMIRYDAAQLERLFRRTGL